MRNSRVLWGLGAAFLLAASGLIGFTLFQRYESSSPDGPAVTSATAIHINGQPIPQTNLDAAFNDLLRIYRQHYEQSGGDFSKLLSGPSGAYYQLQIKYQAAEQLIDRALIRQEAQRRGLKISLQELDQTFQERYQQFLHDNGLAESDLQELFNNPAKKQLTQQILGLRDESAEALKTRLRQEVEDQLLAARLVQAIFGQDFSLSSEEGQQRFNRWLEEVKAGSSIVFSDPLLNAYDLERQIANAQTSEERGRALDRAIAAYEEIKAKHLSQDPHLDYYLAQLYNLKVNADLQLAQQLQTQTSSHRVDPSNLAQLEEEIARNREKASQAFLSFGGNDEQQFVTLLNSDPSNPLYYYLYARFLMAQPGASIRALRELRRAIELDPHYVDAYVLLGDLDVEREYYTEAIGFYRKAVSLSQNPDRGDRTVRTADSQPTKIQQKLAEAYLERARQVEQPPQPKDTAAQRTEAIAQADELLKALLGQLGEHDPAYAAILADLGDVEVLRGNYPAAEKQYQDSLTHSSDKTVQVKLGRAYLLAGQPAQAQATFAGALQMDTHWAPAHLGLADAYKAQGQMKQAMSEYRLAFEQGEALDYIERRQIALDALQLDPNDLEMHLELADYYFQQHVYDGAVEEYQATLKLQPHSVEAFEGLGRVALDKLDYAQAEQYFRTALQQNPSADQQIQIYEQVLKAQQGAAGPGKPVTAEGQNALYQLAALYLKSGALSQSWEALHELQQRYPDYRPNDVASLIQQLTQIVGDSLPGRPVQDQGHQIIAPGEPHPAYNMVPPTSGWHYALPAEWGIHATPISDEVQLRNLASGGVLIQYKPDLSSDMLDQLHGLMVELRKDPHYCRVILAPYDKLDRVIVLTAWDRVDQLDGFDRERIVRFIDAFIGRGSETGEVGCSP